MWFENWESIGEIILTGVIGFIALIFLLRLGGKRTLTKMNAFDFIMTFTIGSTLATTITSDSVNIAEGVTALAVLVFFQYIVAWLEVRSEMFQKILKAKPSILYSQDKFHRKIMKEERITEVEVLAAMRYNGMADPSQAEFVLLETDGQLSVIPKNKELQDFSALRTVKNFHQKQNQ